jgi:hypothetical protein
MLPVKRGLNLRWCPEMQNYRLSSRPVTGSRTTLKELY